MNIIYIASYATPNVGLLARASAEHGIKSAHGTWEGGCSRNTRSWWGEREPQKEKEQALPYFLRGEF